MAGRGTDIKLEAGVVYPRCKVPLSDEEAQSRKADNAPEGTVMSLEVMSNTMYPPGSTKCCIHCDEYDPATNCAHCFKPKLDPRFPAMGRNVCAINVPCGLHIIGTERHEARRIDNQLRGRAGRQGDPGSSRFFLSLEDDLLKLFMPDWMIKMMEKLGFAEGTSLEDKRLTKGIERAQRKVEERNFSSRKHLLEWDEPMDYQRRQFYGARQRILEGEGLRDLILRILDDSIDDAIRRYLAPDYNARCIAEWCKTNLDLVIDPSKVRDDELQSVQQTIREKGKDEARETIRTSLGEYIDPDAPPAEWDLGGLLSWAQRAYKVSISQNQLRRMTPDEIEDLLEEAAVKYFDEVNLDGVELYLDASYPRRALCEWLKNKFNLEVPEEEVTGLSPEEVREKLGTLVHETYRRREIEYPVEVCLDRAINEAAGDYAAASAMIAAWANGKYNAGWTPEQVQAMPPEQVQRDLVQMSRDWSENGKLDAAIDAAMSGHNAEEVLAWARQRFGRAWNEDGFQRHLGGARLARLDELEGGDGAPAGSELREALREQGRHMLRWELARLEHYVLLRIYDQAWKDHLLEMDHLKHAIMQRPMGGDQTHPQSQYAIEGREYFDQMWERIRERVTDIIFKVKMTAQPTPTTGTSGPRVMQMRHEEAGSAFANAARDQQAAMRAQGQESKVETIRREQPRVGRNDPCPCGSGKKYKQCHGRTA
jgi:preprotein translocase subunit SecA